MQSNQHPVVTQAVQDAHAGALTNALHIAADTGNVTDMVDTLSLAELYYNRGNINETQLRELLREHTRLSTESDRQRTEGGC